MNQADSIIAEPDDGTYSDVDYADAVDYGTQRITFGVVWADRTTLGLEVSPDGSVTIRAPKDISREVVRAKVRKRARWITKQQRRVAALPLPSAASKEYVVGETHWFLGRNHRIRIDRLDPDASASEEGLALKGRFYHVRTRRPNDPAHTKHLLTNWFRAQAESRLPDFFARGAETVRPYGIEATEMQVYAMQNRWGSFTPNRRILLNPLLIHAAPYAIEYVVVHELCHLKHPYHDADFYNLLDRLLPTWRDRKATLEKTPIGR
jgi:hypothetical protein